jgi:putative FmdB family regulatory protein
MPIYEYKCETCGKRLEVLQSSSNTYQVCGQVSDCNNQGDIKKLISSFAFKGDSSSADRYTNGLETSPKSPPSSTGCGCHGTSSCPNSNSIRTKYGLE